MLPAVITAKFSKAAIGATLAVALTAASAAPVQALGKNEQKFLQGVAAAMVMDRILDDMRRQQRKQPKQYYSQPAPVYNYVAPAPVYRPAPTPHYQTSIYATPAAAAFNSYSYTDRRRIQQRLAAYGYYRSGIDGSFGPGTYNAVLAYANDRGQRNALGSQAGAYGVYDGLVY